MTELTRDARIAVEKTVATHLAKLIFSDTQPPTAYPTEGVGVWVAIVRAAIVDKNFNAALGDLSLRAHVLLQEAAEAQKKREPGGSPTSPSIARTKH